MGAGASLSDGAKEALAQNMELSEGFRRMQEENEELRKALELATNGAKAAGATDGNVMPVLPPGMAKSDEVTDKMRDRQRRSPAQWAMSMQHWVDVLRHCIQQPEYAALKEERLGKVTMYDINELFVKPWTAGTGCSVAVLMSKEEEQDARLMFSHAWGEHVEELLAAMEQFFKDREMSYDIPVWFCVFGNYQAGDDAGPSIQEQLAMDPFASVIESSGIKRTNGGYGMVAIHTSTADLYGRLWCVHEVDRAIEEAGVDLAGALSDEYVTEVSRRVQMFLDLGSSSDEALAAAGIVTNTSQAKCGNPSDENLLIRTIMARKGGFARLDEAIKRFRVAAIPDVVFNLERFVKTAKEEIRGKIVNVWKIGDRVFEYHDELMARMNELGVDWKEISIKVSEIPTDADGWGRLAESGGLPDLVWGHAPNSHRRYAPPLAHVVTRHSTIMYYMNGVTLTAFKDAKGFETAKKVMAAFDDIPKDTAAWQSRFPASVQSRAVTLDLQKYFICAAVSISTGNASSLRTLCHSKSNYLREVHSAQIQSRPDVVVRAFPVCTWASSSVAIVTGIVSIDSPDAFGNKDLVSFWMKEDGVWTLLSITDDPVNNEEPAIAHLGGWAVEHLAPFQAEPETVDETLVASNVHEESRESTGERFGNWRWKPAESSDPLVQIAEFHYGGSCRLFFKGSSLEESSVSDGELWTTRDMWTLRIWTLRNGLLTISEGIDFIH